MVHLFPMIRAPSLGVDKVSTATNQTLLVSWRKNKFLTQVPAGDFHCVWQDDSGPESSYSYIILPSERKQPKYKILMPPFQIMDKPRRFWFGDSWHTTPASTYIHNVSWDEAEHTCQSQKGFLPATRSKQEVMDMLNLYLKPCAHLIPALYIGLRKFKVSVYIFVPHFCWY